jgi:tetratricopeptide (TPR) repeat protein
VSFTGWWLVVIGYGQYLIPLALLELYLRAQTRGGSLGRFTMAAVLFVFTLGLTWGLLITAALSWVPKVRAALDTRISIADTLDATIAKSGVDAGVLQYRALKASATAAKYNFDERELNDLGYRLIHKGRVTDATTILLLNVEGYPRSANAYDSVGEAYADAGDKPDAIAYYRRSLALNPKNGGAVLMLKKLGAP